MAYEPSIYVLSLTLFRLYPVDKSRIDEDERALMGKDQTDTTDTTSDTEQKSKKLDGKENKKDN